MLRFVAALALAVALVGAAPAQAHKADPNYLTRVDRVTPTTKGVVVDVINRSDQLELRNTSGEEVVIEGYNNDQYARVAADGTVSVNTRSPAYYLNQERYGNVDVPEGIDGQDAPQWKVLDKTGRFEWHDHRMHWMAKSRPPQVKDPDKRTKIFDWQVPVTIAGRPGTIAGDLYWTPQPGAPVGFIIVGSIFVVLVCVAAVIARRRRSDDEDEGGDTAEAW